MIMDKERFISALRTSVAEFERVRKLYPTPNLDLSGANLSGCDLRGAQLGRITLREVSFEGANLTGANLSHSDLRGARFKGAQVIGVNLHKTELEGADFRGAILGGFDADGRVCLNTWMFKGVRWGKEELEHLLDILNQNQDWEIRYQVIPRAGKEG